MRFVILGGGKQGSACALDLLGDRRVERVVIADRELERLPGFLDPFRGDERLELVTLDLADHVAVAAALRACDCALSAAPFRYNYDLARLAVEEGRHFADLGGNTTIVRRQKELHGEAERRGVSVVPDCGLAPGMVNVLAGEGIRRLDATESVRIYVGGLPQEPEPPLNYMVVYSLEGALDYYTSPSWVLRDGKLAQMEALSEVECVEFPPPLGKLEAFHTGGGISTMPFHYEGKVPVMEYKTLRYPGHAAIMRPIRELGLLETEPVLVDGHEIRPRAAFISIVTPRLSRPAGRDLVAMRVEVRGTRAGKPSGTVWELVDKYDEDRHVTAMMRTTGYSLAITGLMQVEGVIPAGAWVPDECVPAAPYLAELAERGILVEERTL